MGTDERHLGGGCAQNAKSRKIRRCDSNVILETYLTFGSKEVHSPGAATVKRTVGNSGSTYKGPGTPLLLPVTAGAGGSNKNGPTFARYPAGAMMKRCGGQNTKAFKKILSAGGVECDDLTYFFP